MELKELDFTYEVEEEKFNELSYSFDVLKDAKTKEQVLNLAKLSLRELEDIIETSYGLEKFSKKETGIISASIIQRGYKYNREGETIMGGTTLKYIVYLMPDGNPKRLSLNLSERDSNFERLFRVYHSILGLPDIEFSREAIVQIKRINFLRKNGFEGEDYICLPEAS